jgi:hypothetical protein
LYGVCHVYTASLLFALGLLFFRHLPTCDYACANLALPYVHTHHAFLMRTLLTRHSLPRFAYGTTLWMAIW